MARREAGKLEQEILRLVGDAGSAVSVTDVQNRLLQPRAYTTVMTTLSRLNRKGALHRSLVGRSYRYELAVPQRSVADAVTARQMRTVLARGGDTAGVLAQFVTDLDPTEQRLLRALLADEPPDPGST